MFDSKALSASLGKEGEKKFVILFGHTERPADANSRPLDQLIREPGDIVQNFKTGEIHTALFPLVLSGPGDFEDEARHTCQFNRDFACAVEKEAIG